MAVATRFCQRTPQLGGMVAARTRHLDDVVRHFTKAGGRDIINVGVGWDMRPFRLPLPAGTRFVELDFPTTLAERATRLADHNIADKPGITRVAIPIDLRTMSVREALEGQIPSDRPVLIIWEGMSMYFEEEEVRQMLGEFKPLLSHPDSLLWFDIVDREPIVNPGAFPESIQGFMHGMQVLGEPFTFGSDTPQEFVESAGLRCLEVVTSDLFFPEANDPVYSVYQFCTLTGEGAARTHLPKTFQSSSFVAPRQPAPKPHFKVDGAPVSLPISVEP